MLVELEKKLGVADFIKSLTEIQENLVSLLTFYGETSSQFVYELNELGFAGPLFPKAML